MKCSSDELKDARTVTFHHWQTIKRANDPTKELAPLAMNLCGRLVYVLGKNNNKTIFKSNDWFKNITETCTKQNLRIRNQLTNIFNFQFHNQVRVNNEILFNVFEISFTDNAAGILNLEDLKKCSDLQTKNVPTSKQKCFVHI